LYILGKDTRHEAPGSRIGLAKSLSTQEKPDTNEVDERFSAPRLREEQLYLGEMTRRHVVATGVRVSGKESNRLAQMMAEETNSTVAAREALGGHDYGETGVRGRLSSLLSQSGPDGGDVFAQEHDP
jgi:hypothetical protein